jgi:hypothetical protein
MNGCPTADVLLDHILKDHDVPDSVVLHVRACASCAQEMTSLRDVCRALAHEESIPSAWVERIMSGLAEEPRRGEATVGLMTVLPTFGLAAATVALAIPILAPGGMRSIAGALAYSVLVGSAVAAVEVFAIRRNPDPLGGGFGEASRG